MNKNILIQVADFTNIGGWKVDTQFVDCMGTPYLLAHGLGTPVEDAHALFEIPEEGYYYIYVYTYNWVAPWHKDMAPGVFELLIDQKRVNKVFGKESRQWNWECSDEVKMDKGIHKLVLRDKTGFEGRVGLILISRSLNEKLPMTASDVANYIFTSPNFLYKQVDEEYDCIICGGGIAGICAALSCARNGLRTALVQDRSVVGGNNSSEVRVWLGGETHFDPFPGVGNIVNELEQSKVGHYGASNRGENYEDNNKLKLLKQEKNLTLFLNQIVYDAKVENNIIKTIKVWDYQSKVMKEITGRIFCDCTGDGNLGYKAGADYEVTTNGHMGMTNSWFVEECEHEVSFPRCPWAINLEGVDFPGKIGVKDIYNNELDKSLGCWFWESGCELDPIYKAEYARDLNFRAMYGAFDTLKNVEHSYKNYRLAYASYIGGKRESRRLLGDVILTKSDVISSGGFIDGCVPSSWNFDVHYPDGRFYEAFREGDAFLTRDYHEPFKKPFFIPYRTMYSRNIQNLFMAGRDISVSHDALGTVRVMRTGGMMGEVLGYAASICIEKKVYPRSIYENYLSDFLSRLKSIKKLKKNKLISNAQ